MKEREEERGKGQDFESNTFEKRKHHAKFVLENVKPAPVDNQNEVEEQSLK